MDAKREALLGFVMGNGKQKFLRFRTGGGDRLIELEHIVECLPMVQLETDDCDGGALYRGLLHYRGSLLPVFEPVEATSGELDPDWFLIVVDDEAHRLALVARDVDDIEACEPGDCRTVEIGDGRRISAVSFEEEIVRVVKPQTIVEGDRTDVSYGQDENGSTTEEVPVKSGE